MAFREGMEFKAGLAVGRFLGLGLTLGTSALSPPLSTLFSLCCSCNGPRPKMENLTSLALLQTPHQADNRLKTMHYKFRAFPPLHEQNS